MAFRWVCDRDWKDPLWGLCRARCPQWHFVSIFQRVAVMSIIVCFYLSYAVYGGTCVIEKHFFQRGVVEISLPFHQLFSINYYRSWVIIYWLNKRPEYLPGTVLVGCGRERYWWKFCPREAYGFEGCHGAVIGCTKLFFLDLFCHRVDSIPSDSFI